MKHRSFFGNPVFFRNATLSLLLLLIAGGFLFMMGKSSADSVPGITAFQAADTGAQSVLGEMKRLDSNSAISRLSGTCSDGVISGESYSGKYSIVFRNSSERPLGCSEKIGEVAVIEATGSFLSERRIVRVATAQSDPNSGSDTNSYLTTGKESQYKQGALGIGGLLKAYLGIHAGGKRVTNVASPEESTDAATKAYVDSAIARVSGGGSGGGGGGGGGGGSGSPSGSCQYSGIKTDAAPGGIGEIKFRDGSGCRECHPEYPPQNRDNNCPFYNTCSELAASGYRCVSSSSDQGDCSGNRTYCTSINLQCTCYKL